MRFSEARTRQVVSTSTADTVGVVDEFVVDPRSRSVVAVLVKKANAGSVLRWRDIAAFGADAVTVTGADAITDPDAETEALTGKDHRLVGKRVLTVGGDELGTVSDVEFDDQRGTVSSLVLADGEIAGSRLLGVGSYAVVVHAEDPR